MERLVPGHAGRRDPAFNGLEETYDLADALVVAMHLNAFIRHAASVRMANLAQLVNVIAPMVTTPDDLLLQTTFYPFELYARTAGTSRSTRLEQRHVQRRRPHRASGSWTSSATLDEDARRSASTSSTATRTARARSRSASPTPDRGTEVEVHTITGPDAAAVNTWDDRDRVAHARRRRSPIGPGARSRDAAGPVRHRAHLHRL